MLEDKAAIDKRLESAGMPVSDTNVFRGGYPEISPKIYREWHERYEE